MTNRSARWIARGLAALSCAASLRCGRVGYEDVEPLPVVGGPATTGGPATGPFDARDDVRMVTGDSGGAAGAGGEAEVGPGDTGPGDALGDDGPIEVSIDAAGDAGGDVVPIDGPSPTVKRVFVSTTAMTSGAFGGNAGGDAICQSLSDGRRFGGTWKAWLSDASNTPGTRFTHASVPYRMIDGTVVANDWNELTSGTLRHAIDLDETGAQSFVEVWTGTVRNGRAEGDHCSAWSSGAATVRGEAGSSSATDFQWTAATLEACDVATAHLYCFEQ